MALLGFSLPVFAATPYAPNLGDTLYAARLSQPTSLAFAPDGSGRLFVTLKETGVMVVGPNNQWHLLFARFPQLYTGSECGVEGLCFDPDYLHNRYVYVFATISQTEQQIFRFVDFGSRGVGRVTIVRGLPTRGQNHNGGAMGFGPDGRLYWGVGDNGIKRGVDGDLASLNAKVGRATRGGVAPIDNPFYDGKGPRNDFIWATGFRNPFKMTFQPQTGQLWLNVVGSSPEGQTSPRSGPGFEQIFALQGGEDGGYDDYEGNQPSGARFFSPQKRPLAKAVIQYRTDYSTSLTSMRREVTSIEKGEGESYTFKVAQPLPFKKGEILTYTLGGAQGFVQQLLVESVLESGFTARGVNPKMPASGGVVTPLANNGCVVGGTFFESSLVPGNYQGSYFFGDFNSGSIFRAVIDETGRPKSPQLFVAGGDHVTDVAVGWDGALYYASHGTDTVHRVSYQSTADVEQGLVVTPTTTRMLEGFSAHLTVRLRKAPESDLVVSPAATGDNGKGNVMVSPATLTFTADNWQKPQVITVTAVADDDLDDDQVHIALANAVAASPDIIVHVKDVGAEAPVLSTRSLVVPELGTASFTVAMAAAPVRPVTMTVRRISGSTHAKVISGASLLFNADNWNVPQTVQVKSTQDRNAVENKATFGVAGGGYWQRTVEVSMPEAAAQSVE